MYGHSDSEVRTQKKFFLDWIWMGNPKNKKNPKIQKFQTQNISKSNFFFSFLKSKFN
jgi:hypothetical protein